MVQLVAIDIDGTLLNSDGELTRRTCDTIQRITNKGIQVVLTSGRVTNSVKAIADRVHASGYIICDNGASIYDTQKGETIWSREIPHEIVVEFIKMCVEHHIYYMVFTDSEIIVKDLKHMALVFYKRRHHLVEEYSGVSEFRFAGLDYIQKLDKPVRRIVVCDEDRSIFKAIMNKIETFPEVSSMMSPYETNHIVSMNQKKMVLSYSYAEILPKGVNKWTAIDELIKRLHISSHDVMAIGDNFNDVEMIQNAGFGVAMNNGAPVCKNVARVIAPSNNEDGVALILERYVLS